MIFEVIILLTIIELINNIICRQLYLKYTNNSNNATIMNINKHININIIILTTLIIISTIPKCHYFTIITK